MKVTHIYLLHILLVVLLSLSCSSCALFRKNTSKGMMDGYASTLSTERVISEAKTYMRQKELQNKYDLNSGIAYDKGKYWTVCFKPRKGFFKRCVDIYK